MVTRSYQMLLQPTAGQQRALTQLLDAQRELYNAALEERRGAWRLEHRSVTRYEQYRGLTGFDHPLLGFGVVPARGTLLRLDRAFQSFFRRVKAGEPAGFPRFRSKARFDSVEYPDLPCWKVEGARLYLKGVGSIRWRGAKRGLRGVPKTMTLRREGRRWRATVFCTNVVVEPLAPSDRAIGIDLGVTELVATSDGDLIENPRWVKQSAERLAGAQRLVAGRNRGSKRRAKAGERVGAIHRKLARQRRDHHHQLSRRLVNHYGVIAHEALSVANLTRRPRPRPNAEGGYDPNGAAAKSGLNREILSAGWGQLLRMLAYKAEEAGRQLVAVDPRHTSQTCVRCGLVDGESRKGAVFRCTACGHEAHADINAAQNILRAGLALRRVREAA